MKACEAFDIDVRTGAAVKRVEKTSGGFVVHAAIPDWCAKAH